jgi:hypothetical protein
VSNALPYTHWAYFPDQASAEACAWELDARFDCLTAVDPSTGNPGEWLLRAGRTVRSGTDWHSEIADVVERHGGHYDGGEMALFVPPSPGPVESP